MNSTDKNTFQNAAKKVFSDLYALIKEDEKETENKIDNNKKDNKNVKSNKKDNKNVISNKIDNKIVKSNKIDDKNVISNEIDDKPKPVNLLDLSTDIIGDFVKKDSKRREIKELMDEEQIINGKTIEFGTFINTDIVVPLNTKEDIKDYIFHYINLDFQQIKKICKKRKVRLINDDIWKCFLISFKRFKILLDINKGYYNKDRVAATASKTEWWLLNSWLDSQRTTIEPEAGCDMGPFRRG
jgi:hypothetical protein